MDSAVPGGSSTPLIEDVDPIAVVVEEDEGFESLYDVPFVTVNRIGNLIEAEVWLSGVAEIDFDRISAALTEGRKYGYTSYSRIFGDDGQVLIQFSNNPDEGLIWALESDLASLPAW